MKINAKTTLYLMGVCAVLASAAAQAQTLPLIGIGDRNIGVQPLPQIGIVAPAGNPAANNYLNAEADRAAAESAYLREKTITERAGIYANDSSARGLIGTILESERNARPKN